MQDNEEQTYPKDLEDLDDLEWVRPPRDVHDTAGWNRYWENEINEGMPGFHDMFLRDEWLVKAIKGRGLQTVLCAGNGVSIEPHVLAYAGLTVTAADLSDRASEFCRRVRPHSKYLKQCLYGPIFFRRMFSRSVMERVRWLGDLLSNAQKHLFNPLRRREGMFECLAGDLLNPDFCKGPFDVVIERRMVQLFSEKERAEVLENLTARLNPGGIFVSHCHMGWWRPGMSREHLFASWFREHGFEIGGWRSRDNVQASRDSMPIAFLSVSTG